MWIIPISEAWRELIFQVHGHHLKQMHGITFSPESLNLEHLRNLQKRIPFDCHIQRVDISLASQLKMKGFPVSQVSVHSLTLLNGEIGFCATIEGRIISHTVSLMECREGIHIGLKRILTFATRDLRQLSLLNCLYTALSEAFIRIGLPVMKTQLLFIWLKNSDMSVMRCTRHSVCP